MRRNVAVALLAVVSLAISATSASGTPSVRLSAHAEPIPEFGHTGNIAGAGASVLVQLDIEGSEYGGLPPPLTGLSLRLPPGVRWDTSGFPTCPTSVLEPTSPGPHACPRGSQAEPEASAALDVAFGSEIVAEQAMISFSYQPRGGLALKILGHSPVLVEAVEIGAVKEAPTPARGQLLSFKWPLVETVPNAALASFTSLGIRLGSGIRLGPSTQRMSLRMPRRCPRGYLPYRIEASFAGVGGLPAQLASASYRAPCPRGSAHHH